MHLLLRRLDPAPADLGLLNNEERRIDGGAIWCLPTIQQMLATDSLSVIYSRGAEKTAINQLLWNMNNAIAFMK